MKTLPPFTLGSAVRRSLAILCEILCTRQILNGTGTYATRMDGTRSVSCSCLYSFHRYANAGA
jgi:hypothetical protein